MNVGRHRRSSRRGLSLAVMAGLILMGVSSRLSAAEPKSEQKRTTGAKLDYVDSMIRDSWESESVKPSPVAKDEEFLRRAYLDVLGRIPNISEAKAFLSSKDTGRRAKLVEYLLSHPDYAKNF